MASVNRDIATILGRTEAANPTKAVLTSTADGSGLVVYATPNLLPTSGLTAGDQAFVTSNSRIYISNGSGWYNVALINSTPTFTPAPNATYALSNDLTPTVITLLAQDSDGQVVTYSATDSGMDGIATLSQDSSVFTVTPLTDSAGGNTGTFTITFQATDGIGIASSVSTFTLSFGVTVINNVDLSTGYRIGGYITNAEIDTWGAGTGGNETINGLGLSSDGNYLFLGCDRTTQVGATALEPLITRYDMSTPYDYTSQTVNTGQTVTNWGGDTNFRGMHVSYDGYHIFLCMGGDGLHHFTMSTAWDLTSRSLTQKYHDDGVVCAVNGYIAGFHMNHDGTRAYTAGNSAQGFSTYLTLSTPWDLTTATLRGTYSPPSPFNSTRTLRDIWLSHDGSQVILCNANPNQSTTENLASWDLTTPWILSTATNPVAWPNTQLDVNNGVVGEFSISPQGGGGQGGNNGTIIFSHYSTNQTYQVDIATVSVT